MAQKKEAFVVIAWDDEGDVFEAMDAATMEDARASAAELRGAYPFAARIVIYAEVEEVVPLSP
jgi:hypothetical protein